MEPSSHESQDPVGLKRSLVNKKTLLEGLFSSTIAARRRQQSTHAQPVKDACPGETAVVDPPTLCSPPPSLAAVYRKSGNPRNFRPTCKRLFLFCCFLSGEFACLSIRLQRLETIYLVLCPCAAHKHTSRCARFRSQGAFLWVPRTE